MTRAARACCAGWIALVLCALAPGARADAAAARTEARAHFDRGLERFGAGDYAAASAEFERAQSLSPSEVVLFNLGLVYAALNRPVDAVAVLDRILTVPGSLSPEHLERARRARDEQAHRIAELEVSCSVVCAIEVDGLHVGRTPLDRPLRLSSGAHVVSALAPGHFGVRKEVILAGEVKEELHFSLLPMDQPRSQLRLHCPLPGASIFVDDQPVGRTPLSGGVAVAPGRHAITLSRPGYRSTRRELHLEEGGIAQLVLDLEEDPSAPASLRARLAIAASEPDVHVRVDGRPRGVYQRPLTLVSGPHVLEVQREGFEVSVKTVVLEPGQDVRVAVQLVATPKKRLEHAEAVQRRRRNGIVMTTIGAALTLGGTILGAVSQAALPELRRTLEAEEDASTPGSGEACDPMLERDREACLDAIDQAEQRLRVHSGLRTAGFVTAAVGAALAVPGIVLLAVHEDEHKYDRPPRVQLAGAVGSRGGLLLVRAAF